MVNTSKVLTVSYGTFSCTLEGFDDSFDTMKAIAEYFRDLAAEDRYFGAEPPTPDADMLARIAEREVSRHVEAHRDGENIVLRTRMPESSAIAAPASLMQDLPDAVEPDAVEPEIEARIEDAEAEATAKAQTDVATEQARIAEQAEKEARQEEERVAAEEAERAQAKAERRARIAKEKADAEAAEAEALDKAARMAEAKAAKEAAIQAKLEAEEKAAQGKAEEDAAEQAANEAKAAADAKIAQDAADKAARNAELNAEAEEEARLEAEEEAARLAEEKAKATEADQDGDSVAAKLARIRAVVGHPSGPTSAPGYSEDEHADEILQGRPGDTDLEDLIETDVKAEIDTSDAQANDTISGVMSRLAAQASPEIEEFEEDALEEIAQEPEIAAPALEEAPKAPIRARVIKMKREEFEAAIASGDIEEEVDADDISDAGSAQESVQEPALNSSLSDNDEDELARELAAVEAELAGLPAPEAEFAPEPIYDAVEPVVEHASRGVDELAVEPDVEVDRLMDQASSELEEPDGKKRRNALGHLRAAVAAARADKSAPGTVEPVDETESYRSDLESAVQPRRAVRRLQAHESAPAAARPPLKLVAEQRVDAPAAALALDVADTPAPQPVRPRRIKAGQTPPPAPLEQATGDDEELEGGSFLEFAEEMGATELPDLLEAAAAYLAYVEGKDQFSRPQLMTKVRLVQEENFSREDGLRSFGQLLRQGKIEKISGGRFTVSDRISFKPDTRAAG